MTIMESMAKMYVNAISQMMNAGAFDGVKYGYQPGGTKGPIWQTNGQSDQAWCSGHTVSFTHPDFTDPDEKDIIDVEFREVPTSEE